MPRYKFGIPLVFAAICCVFLCCWIWHETWSTNERQRLTARVESYRTEIGVRSAIHRAQEATILKLRGELAEAKKPPYNFWEEAEWNDDSTPTFEVRR